jgi:receptor expression-enhancing protein 5/6
MALETKDDDNDDKTWLTYWCVFGVFTLVDEFASFLLNIIPFYAYIKLVFFIWMMHPKT